MNDYSVILNNVRYNTFYNQLLVNAIQNKTISDSINQEGLKVTLCHTSRWETAPYVTYSDRFRIHYLHSLIYIRRKCSENAVASAMLASIFCYLKKITWRVLSNNIESFQYEVNKNVNYFYGATVGASTEYNLIHNVTYFKNLDATMWLKNW